MSAVTCQMKDIILERGKEFRLCIPELHLPGKSGVNKIPLMGISGAGKSTLMNIMSTIVWPHSGKIQWSFPDGRTAEWGKKGMYPGKASVLRRKYFGYAFQDNTLIPHLSVRDNLCYPLLLRGYSNREAADRAKELLIKVLIEEKENINDLFNRFPSKLSGGQRQRVALVQSMVHDPCVIFADEPTGSLDRFTRRKVMKVLEGWADDQEFMDKRLLLWVTHHEKDPADAKVPYFLKIEGGKCQWCNNLVNQDYYSG